MAFSRLSVGLAIFSATALAAPQIVAPWPTLYCPIVDEKTPNVDGKPWQVGKNVGGGGTLGINEEKSVSYTWSVGGDLGIDVGGLSGGLGFSVSKSITETFGETAEYTCPEGKWRCSLQVVFDYVRVRGHLHDQDNDESCPTSRVGVDEGGEEGKKFEYMIPMKSESGNSVFKIDLCTCKNKPNWADKGHPPILCPEDCA